MDDEGKVKQTIQQVVDTANEALNALKKPAYKVPAFLTYVTSVSRPGISRNIIAANIIAENGTYGINTGQMPDGTDNVVNKFVYNVVEKVIDELKDNALVECTIPPGSVIVRVKGGNAGGPIEAVGTNVNYGKGYGIIR